MKEIPFMKQTKVIPGCLKFKIVAVLLGGVEEELVPGRGPERSFGNGVDVGYLGVHFVKLNKLWVFMTHAFSLHRLYVIKHPLRIV